MNKISLIGTTLGGRDFEVERLFKSLEGTRHFVELVFVDQSGENNVFLLVQKYQSTVAINYIKSEKVSLSKARNLALKQSTGDVIGFCDDDAFYDYESLLKLSEIEITQNALVSVPVIDKSSGEMYGGRTFPEKCKNISFLEIIRYSLSVGTFILLFEKNENVIFDERLGAGTRLGGSEETELFFRLKSNNFVAKFNASLFVYHDNDASIDISKVDLSAKYYKYALGYGVVLKAFLIRSNFTLTLEVINITLRCVLGSVLLKDRNLYTQRLRGFYRGLFCEGRLK